MYENNLTIQTYFKYLAGKYSVLSVVGVKFVIFV